MYNTYRKQFTSEKLSGLIGKFDEDGKVKDSSLVNVDMDFLKLHKDKLQPSTLEDLQNLVNERSKLSDKKVKTEVINQKIRELDEQIKEKQSKIYKEIIGWYLKYDADTKDFHDSSVPFALNFDVSMFSHKNILYEYLNAVNDSFKYIIESVKIYDSSLEAYKKEYESYKEKKKQDDLRIEPIKQEMLNVIQQIKQLVGPELDETVEKAIESAIMDEDPLDTIAKLKADELLKNIQINARKAAQKQSDMEEAKIKGITLEELYEERKTSALKKALTDGDGENIGTNGMHI